MYFDELVRILVGNVGMFQKFGGGAPARRIVDTNDGRLRSLLWPRYLLLHEPFLVLEDHFAKFGRIKILTKEGEIGFIWLLSIDEVEILTS